MNGVVYGVVALVRYGILKWFRNVLSMNKYIAKRFYEWKIEGKSSQGDNQ